MTPSLCPVGVHHDGTLQIPPIVFQRFMVDIESRTGEVQTKTLELSAILIRVGKMRFQKDKVDFPENIDGSIEKNIIFSTFNVTLQDMAMIDFFLHKEIGQADRGHILVTGCPPYCRMFLMNGIPRMIAVTEKDSHCFTRLSPYSTMMKRNLP